MENKRNQKRSSSPSITHFVHQFHRMLKSGGLKHIGVRFHLKQKKL